MVSMSLSSIETHSPFTDSDVQLHVDQVAAQTGYFLGKPAGGTISLSSRVLAGAEC